MAILRVVDTLRAKNRLGATSLSRGGGVLPLMAYMGWLRPIGVPFSGFDYMKGEEYP